MYYVSSLSLSQCLTLIFLFTFCNSPKQFTNKVILLHIFFLFAYTFQLQILSLLANKIWKSPGRHSHVFEQNLVCNAKIILYVVLLHFQTYQFAFMVYFLESLSLIFSVLGYTIMFTPSFWLVKSLVITKFTLMERIRGINPLRKEESWAEVSHTCGEQPGG